MSDLAGLLFWAVMGLLFWLLTPKPEDLLP